MSEVDVYTGPKRPTAKQFAKIRADSGLSQEEFARQLKLSKRALQYYESGERPVPEWLVYRLIKMKMWSER